MISTQPIRRWLVLYVRPRYEKKVDQQLLDAGIESFLPLREELRQWSDRRKRVIVPLFPGYIFVHVNERERIEAFQVHGALKYVNFAGALAEVRDEVIESLKIAVASADELEVVNRQLQPGAGVRVTHGPMTGMMGNLVEYRGAKKVAIVVESIGQTVMLELALTEVEEIVRK